MRLAVGGAVGRPYATRRAAIAAIAELDVHPLRANRSGGVERRDIGRPGTVRAGGGHRDLGITGTGTRRTASGNPHRIDLVPGVGVAAAADAQVIAVVHPLHGRAYGGRYGPATDGTHRVQVRCGRLVGEIIAVARVTVVLRIRLRIHRANRIRVDVLVGAGRLMRIVTVGALHHPAGPGLIGGDNIMALVDGRAGACRTPIVGGPTEQALNIGGGRRPVMTDITETLLCIRGDLPGDYSGQQPGGRRPVHVLLIGESAAGAVRATMAGQAGLGRQCGIMRGTGPPGVDVRRVAPVAEGLVAVPRIQIGVVGQRAIGIMTFQAEYLDAGARTVIRIRGRWPGIGIVQDHHGVAVGLMIALVMADLAVLLDHHLRRRPVGDMVGRAFEIPTHTR